MPINFDELPLSAEGKQKLLAKFHSSDDATKSRVLQKVNIPMQLQDQNPGLRSVEPVTDTLKKGLEAYEENAPILEEGLKGAGINPTLAKAAATTFKYIPEIAGGAKGAAEVGPSVVKGAVNMGKAIKSGYTGFRDALKGTGEKEVMALSEKMAELPLKQGAKQEATLALKKTAQKGIQTAEEEAGIGLSNTPSTVIRANLKSPDKVVQFADRMDYMTQNGTKGLEKASTKVLSHYREITKAALKDKTLPQDVKIRLEKSQKVLNEAISSRVPAVGEELSKFKEIQGVLESLGPQFKKEKQMLQLALKKAQNLAKRQQGIRTGAKWATAGGLSGVGMAAAKKLMGS